jgi:hypothetical protein
MPDAKDQHAQPHETRALPLQKGIIYAWLSVEQRLPNILGKHLQKRNFS